MYRIAAPAAFALALSWAAPAHAMDGVPWGEALFIVFVWAGLLFFVILNPLAAVGIMLAALLIKRRLWAVGAGALWGGAMVIGINLMRDPVFGGGDESPVAAIVIQALGGALWTWGIHAVATWVRRRRGEG